MIGRNTESMPISKSRILSAARKRFETVGYKRTTIAQIAQEAGVAVGTVYRYFESKEDVLAAVLEQTNETWLEKARETAQNPGTALERIMRLAEASVVHNRDNALLNAIWNRDTEFILAPLLDDLYEWVHKQNLALVADVIRDGVRDGTLRETDPEKTAFILFMFGRSLFDQKDVPYSKLVPTMLDIILNGVRKSS